MIAKFSGCERININNDFSCIDKSFERIKSLATLVNLQMIFERCILDLFNIKKIGANDSQNIKCPFYGS